MSIDSELFERAIVAERRRKRVARVFGFVLASAILTPVAYLVLALSGPHAYPRSVLAPLSSVAFVAIMFGCIAGIQWIAAHTTMSFAQPGGATRAPVGSSRAESLAAAGLMAEASREFDAARAQRGDTIALLRAEAELHATAAGDPKRAEELFLRIRRSANATRSDELYASHRLIDLYIGLLDDPGRVMVELRRMAERFPDTIDGDGALAELNRRRAEDPTA